MNNASTNNKSLMGVRTKFKPIVKFTARPDHYVPPSVRIQCVNLTRQQRVCFKSFEQVSQYIKAVHKNGDQLEVDPKYTHVEITFTGQRKRSNVYTLNGNAIDLDIGDAAIDSAIDGAITAVQSRKKNRIVLTSKSCTTNPTSAGNVHEELLVAAQKLVLAALPPADLSILQQAKTIQQQIDKKIQLALRVVI